MNQTKSRLYVRALCEGAILLAVAIVLNYLSKVVFANMPNGRKEPSARFACLLTSWRKTAIIPMITKQISLRGAGCIRLRSRWLA